MGCSDAERPVAGRAVGWRPPFSPTVARADQEKAGMAQISIGADWKAVFDAAQGKFYYTKGSTTQWEWPEAEV